MARPRNSMPEMRYHVSGQARVFLDGKYWYLGPHGSVKAQTRYDTLLAKWLANGRKVPESEDTHQADKGITVQNVTAEYRRLIEKRPKQLSRYKHLCTLVEDEYGDELAKKFGPLKLDELRDLLVVCGNARPTVNEYVRVIVLMFKHAVSRELIEANVLVALDTLEPLKEGQTVAPEFKTRQPVDIAIATKTAEFLSPPVRAIIALQASTAMRPSEIFNMRPVDIDKSGAEWFYRPEHHKTERHGISKAVPILGPARLTLAPFLDRDPEAYCFSPKESAQWHREQRSAKRTTPDGPGRNKPGTNRKKNPKRQPGEKFAKDSLNQAVKRACEKAGVERWTPYQLRHTAATAVAEAMGLDGARALLGHSSDRMTMRYVKTKQDEAKAIEAAKVAPTIG